MPDIAADLTAISETIHDLRSRTSDAVSRRDAMIITAHRAGMTDKEIADMCALDRGRVTRIVSAAVGARGQGRRRQA